MIELRANAKINLFLDILAKLPNGYHSLFMVMQSVSLADIVTVSENGEGIIRLTCSEPALPTDSKNIAYRAAQAFLEEAGSSAGALTYILKSISRLKRGLPAGARTARELSSDLTGSLKPIWERRSSAISGLKSAATCRFASRAAPCSPSTRAAYSPVFRRLKAALSCSQSPQRASRLRAPTGISIPRTIYIIRTRSVCSTPPQTAISRAYARHAGNCL